MPRAYADVIGSFRHGEAGAYARNGDYAGASRALAVDDPEMSESYRRRGREEEASAYQRNYATDVASGNYDAAISRAGKFGDVQGVTAARAGQAQMSSQEREERGRQALEYLSGIEGIDQVPQDQRDTAWQQWLQSAQAGADEQGRQFLQTLPPTYNPIAVGNLRNRLDGVVNQMFSVEELARMRRGGSGERRYTSASGGILDTFTGNVSANPHYVRGGGARDDGPPAPPDGYRIVGGQ